jgi:Flp pilus assembly protein TadG
MIVLFALALSVIVILVGLVIDGGNALVQRRGAQNAADFGAMAGARIVAELVGGDTTNGTDANVRAAIDGAVAANGGTPITYGAPNGPRYIDSNGALLGYVTTGAIPSTAAGVTLSVNRTWRPFFLGLIGLSSWTASANATATGGFSSGPPPAGTLFPAGISTSFFSTYPFCSGPVSTDPTSACYPQHLTPGNLNVPGGFGWLKFGCDGYGLGQVPPANIGGCQENKPFLDSEIGPPSNSYGFCTVVWVPGSADRIGSIPGNKVSADCDYYIDNEVTVTVPIWDVAGGPGANGWYHIVGFAGFQLTNCTGGKDIEGVWRKAFWNGPTTTTPSNPGVPQQLGVQLIR